jgi:hypothetical protein
MFGKRQKKLDPRVRYQHQNFTRKLQQARGYKRESQPLPEDWRGYILTKLGLKTRFSQILSIIVLFGLIYLVFIPNFLSAKNTKVLGLGEEDTKRVEADVTTYLNDAPFYLAQHNLVFLSKGRLAQELLQDKKIFRVKEIKKSLLSRTVTVTVEMKAPHFVAKRNGQVYSIYNDGSVQEQLNLDASQWLTARPELVKIEDHNIDSIYPDQAYLSPDLINKINLIVERFKPAVNNEIDYFVIPANNNLPLQPDDVVVMVKKPNNKPDYKVIFDASQNWDEAFNKLTLLFSQMPVDRYNKLIYVDLRFADRAFLCLADALCAKEPEPLPPPDQPSSDLFNIESPSSTNPEIK